MKKMSLAKCSLFISLGMGIPCILSGSISLMVSNGLLEKSFRTVAGVIMMVLVLLSLLMITKVKSDVWDETAEEHYAKAHRLTFRLVSRAVLAIMIVLTVLEAMQISFELRAGHLWIFYGVMHMILWGSFAYVEKRDA